MQGESKVPLLGGVPILGNLFRNKNGTAHSVVRLFLIKAEPQPIGPQPALAKLSKSLADEGSVATEIAQ
ncbi:hypothetical protein EBME_1418 [bacterium endosymbiont of Mortierella elongata FMR23-6]|nr:hypothetical protein EBME_1418 [bacterium endosymbiont of Mortierella elongata FMR23-6]